MNANYKVSESPRFADSKVLVVCNWHWINDVGLVPYTSMEDFEKNMPTVTENVVAVFKNIKLK